MIPVRHCELDHPPQIRVWKDTRGWCWTCDDCGNCRRRGVIKTTAQYEVQMHAIRCSKDRMKTWLETAMILTMVRWQRP